MGPAMRHAALCLLVLLALPDTAASVPPAITWYDVQGSTLHEVGEWMDRHGPAGADGRRFHGYTEWAVRWRYRYRPGRTGCAVTALETDLTVTMQLPRWLSRADASPAAIREWDRYSAALRAHEDGHAEIGASAAEAIRQSLSALRSASSCEALAKELDDRGMAIIEEHQAREREYDASTRHGATQGARLQVDQREAR